MARRFVYGRDPAQLIPSGLTPTTMQSSVSQYGITWTFDQAYPVGQFINGDYFVVENSAGTGVTISSVSPGWTGNYNGSMVNPSTGSQGWDARQSYSSATRETFASAIPAGSSVVSAVSADTGDSGARPVLDDVAILTVLASAPHADQFRPPYCGTTKTVYRWGDVNTALLPDNATTASTPADIASYIASSQRPWISCVSSTIGHWFHPNNNMPDWYHRGLGRYLGAAWTLVMMNVDSDDRNDLLRNLIQIGIDWYATALNGQPSTAFWGPPVVLAGRFLGDADMCGMFVNGTQSYELACREMDHFYTVATDQLSTVVSGTVPVGKTWTGKDYAWRQSLIASNCYENEHLHPDEWASVSSSEGCPSGLGTRETYRRINSPCHVGFACALHQVDAEQYMWDETLYMTYVKRWMDEDLSDGSNDVYGDGTTTILNNGEPFTEYASSTNDFVDEFYAAHGIGVI